MVPEWVRKVHKRVRMVSERVKKVSFEEGFVRMLKML